MRRTNHDMFRQLEELTVENEQPEKENKELRAENARLTQRFEALEMTVEERVNKAVEEAVGYDELRRMVKCLENYKDSHLLFMGDYEAPFTNNEAERGLRHCKTRQKVSGCFRSWEGVVDYCAIRSLLATAKKRGQNLLIY